jgi:hypothetical protein
MAEKSEKVHADEYNLARLMISQRSTDMLPPRVRGGLRVTYPSAFAVAKATSYFGGTEFTLSWVDPELTKIDHYDIWALALFSDNKVPTRIGSAQKSPAAVRVTATAVGVVVFLIQPVLSNGYAAPLELCPTCTGLTVAPTTAGSIPVGSITIDLLANGTPGQLITWAPTGVSTVIGPGAVDKFLVGAGAGAVPVFKSTEDLSIMRWRVTTKSANFTVDNTFDVYLVDASGGAVTVTLPAVATRKTPVVINKTDATLKLVTIVPDGTEKINGFANMIIEYGETSLILVPVSGGWRIT